MRILEKTEKKYSQLSNEQKTKANCRTIANIYKKRGKITVKPCYLCNSSNVEMHHTDYSKPLDVIFVCKKHHRMLHK